MALLEDIETIPIDIQEATTTAAVHTYRIKFEFVM